MKPFSLTRSDIDELIQDALLKAGTVAKLAKEIGVCRQTIANWIDGIAPPRRDSIAKLLNFIREKPNKRIPRYLLKSRSGICDDCGEYDDNCEDNKDGESLFVFSFCPICTTKRLGE